MKVTHQNAELIMLHSSSTTLCIFTVEKTCTTASSILCGCLALISWLTLKIYLNGRKSHNLTSNLRLARWLTILQQYTIMRRTSLAVSERMAHQMLRFTNLTSTTWSGIIPGKEITYQSSVTTTLVIFTKTPSYFLGDIKMVWELMNCCSSNLKEINGHT